MLANQVPIHDLILDNTVMGSSLNTVGVVAYSATSSPGYLDALRISNDANVFFNVTGVSVPEPGAMALLAVGSMAVYGYRRRRFRRVEDRTDV